MFLDIQADIKAERRRRINFYATKKRPT